MKKEKRISYEGGITRMPSDFLCKEGELAECINLVTDHEELKVNTVAKELFTTTDGVTILYVHKFNNTSRYIGYFTYEDNTHQEKTVYGYYFEDEEAHTLTRLGVLGRTGGRIDHLFYQEGVKITSIGKTLIVSDGDGLHYFLWNSEGYKSIGDKLPELDISFRLMHPGDSTETYDTTGTTDALNDNPRVIATKQTNFNDFIFGLYAENKKKLSHLKQFTRPFLVRAAYKLYDDSYAMPTQPVMMFPSVTRNSFLHIVGYSDGISTCVLHTYYSALYYNLKTSLEGWEDIVKNVTIFITDGIEIYDIYTDAVLTRLERSEYVAKAADSIQYTVSRNEFLNLETFYDPAYSVMKQRPANDIISDLLSSSVFYALCDIGIKQTGKWSESTASLIKPFVLENITTQDQLENDDYYSHTKLVADFVYAYNSRLNMSGVSRGFFEGYDNFLPYDNVKAVEYRFYVTIKTDSGEKIIKHTATTAQKQGIWFYYPDPRASHVVIAKEGTGVILDEDLTEHPGLNGAYYFRGLPTEDYKETAVSGVEEPTEINNGDVELLPNYIIQSEVNNPFTFAAAGYHKVSTGKIIGMSSTTMALSQDQFGQTDLIVFSDTGLWGMKVDRTGAYGSIHSISRDVCINPKSITQTDNAIFFVSKKGLMVVTENGVRCVSEQMNGQTFDTRVVIPAGDAAGTTAEIPAGWRGIIEACQDSRSFLEYIRDKSCMMAYDYIGSQLLIINPAYGYSYVFSMPTGAISKILLPSGMVAVLNDYPDYLLQGEDGKVYSLYEKPREEEVTERQYAFLLTRPLKLSGPLTVTSLRELMNVGKWDETGGSLVKTDLWVSDNLRDWYLLRSRFGAAFKYARIGLYIKMLPTERLSGTILMEEERRNVNLR